MKEILDDLLAKKKKLYRDNPDEMLGDYKRELETAEGYNGRQLLELLQNCDDEGAKEVLIKLDTTNSTISISNDGTPFSEKGYRSLFIANLSSKTSKKKYIGNKGLGFRSIINWSSEIEIISNNLSLKYNPQNLKAVFENLFTKEERIKILNEEGLKEDVVPLPMLSIPEITQHTQNIHNATTIVICYKELFFEDIIKQLNGLTSDLLLFLRNIESIKFLGIDGKNDIICLREELPADGNFVHKEQQLILNDRIWTVYSIEEELEEKYSDENKKEKELYQISIAIEQNMAYSADFLYSFFPTNIKLKQPYVLHATFDLDPTRNQINDTPKNTFILKKIVAFTIDLAKHIAKEKVTYEPLKILFHPHKADTLMNFQYYDLIEDAIKTQPLFPCINETYQTLKEVIFISNPMSALLKDIHGEEILNCHLILVDDDAINTLIKTYEVDSKISVLKDFHLIINSLSALDLSIGQRAKFITLLYQNLRGENLQGKRLQLLIDDKQNLIDGYRDIYTSPTNDKKLKVPDFAKIHFIDPLLFETILKFYKAEDYEKRGKARFVYDILKDFCNIHSYEPATLAEKIVRATNEFLNKKDDNDEKVKLIQEMMHCLYYNYRSQSDRTKISLENIPCLTKAGTIKHINELHLSTKYPIGENVEILFDTIYSASDYIASPDMLGFEESEPVEFIESFLIWLGVNEFFKFIKAEEKEYYGKGRSLAHHPFLLFTKTFRGDTNNYTGYDVNYVSIKRLDEIFKKLDVVKLIVLAYIDKNLRTQLNNQDQKDLIRLRYNGEIPIYNTPSYLKYKVLDFYKTTGFLLDEKFAWINDVQIDYNHQLFQKFSLNKIRVKEILLNLGAVEAVNDLSIEALSAAFVKFNNKFPDGSGSQQFYKKALSHYDLHGEKLTKKIKLFGKTNNDIGLFNQTSIYFSDNNFLPISLSSAYPIFNFPLRAGAKKAIEFFEINDLHSLRVNIEKVTFFQRLESEFLEYFNSIRPYIIAYRLEAIEKEDVINDQIVRLKNLRFKFCAELICKVVEEEFSLADHNYIYNPKDKTYYIKVNEDTTTESLRQSPLFVDNFSEILLNAFATSSEKQQFESLLRDTKETIDYNIGKLLGDNALEEAKNLLGLVNSKTNFWNIIFTLLNIMLPKNEMEQEKIISSLLGAENFNINYNDIANLKNLPTLSELFKKLDITVRDFNEISLNKISTKALNLKNLNNHLSTLENRIKQGIWNYLQKIPDEQKLLLNYFNRIELIKNEYEYLSDEIKSDFSFDCPSANLTLLKKHLQFINFDKLSEEITFLNIYKRNKNAFNQEEIILVESDPELHSLLYFDDKDVHKKFIDFNKDKSTLPTHSIVKQVSDSLAISVEYSTNLKTFSKTLELHKSSIYNPGSKNGLHNKAIGNIAEDLAFNKLIELYGEKFVIHKSKETEWEHYDIKYSKDGGENWIYVEVKSAAMNKFIITVWEKRFGESKSDEYEIWVWRNEKFTVLKDFYKNNPILNPTEFEVILEN